MWGTILKTVLGMILGRNQGSGAGIAKSALGMINSGRSVPEPQARQM